MMHQTDSWGFLDISFLVVCLHTAHKKILFDIPVHHMAQNKIYPTIFLYLLIFMFGKL